MARSAIVDPLEKFRFIVSWSSDSSSEGTALVRAGFHDVQLPKRTTNKINYREGDDLDISSVSAGLSTMEDVVLSRGLIASDINNEFYKWTQSVAKHSAGPATYAGKTATSSRPSDAAALLYRKEVSIKMLDRAGNTVRQWKLFNAFPSHFVVGSDLNSREDGDKSLEQVTLAYEDFQELDPASGNPV